MVRSLPTYYDVLRVDRRATPEGIRHAYRRLAQQYHPDKMPGNANAGRAMAAINAAYEVLSDAQQRAEHDRWIRKAESGPAPLAPHAPVVSRWSAAWPWYLLFATMAFAVVTVLTAAVVSAMPARQGGPAPQKALQQAPAQVSALPAAPL
jgi:hypothetical protein